MVERDTDESEGGGAAPVKVGDLIIDPATGEVLSRAGASSESEFDQLTRVCAEAQRTIKEAQTVLDAARAALLRLLADEGLTAMRTPHGTASLRTRVTRTGRPDRVEEIVRRYELARDQVEQIWMCAATLDAKKLDALVEAGALPVEAADEIVDTRTVSYVQVSAR
jgi:hypothetical protein